MALARPRSQRLSGIAPCPAIHGLSPYPTTSALPLVPPFPPPFPPPFTPPLRRLPSACSVHVVALVPVIASLLLFCLSHARTPPQVHLLISRHPRPAPTRCPVFGPPVTCAARHPLCSAAGPMLQPGPRTAVTLSPACSLALPDVPCRRPVMAFGGSVRHDASRPCSPRTVPSVNFR